MKKFIIIGVVTIAVVAAVFLLKGSKEKTEELYTFTEIEQGDLEQVVSATGTLSAVTTVQVGTQVSGRIAELFVDFNDKVKKGQLLVQLDTLVLRQNVNDAENALNRAQLQREQAEMDLKRTKYLFEENLKTQNDLDQAQYAFNLAKSNAKSSASNLEKAKINLEYASIYSPIDGTIIQRQIDVGQTVAASFSSPTLFLIANDLKKMQIQANVDESDIGEIKNGQKARFTVQTYQNQTFMGEVSQIRLQPQTVSNVVNYTVVVNVENAKEILLPGMTATIDFIIGQATDVLKVANAALRIRPTEEMTAMIRKSFEERMKERVQSPNGQQPAQAQPDGATRRNGSGMGGMFGSFGQGGNGAQGARRPRNGGMLWYLDEAGKMQFLFVRTGISDGQFTEIKTDKVKKGMKIIKTINTESETPAGPMGRGPSMRMF